MCVCTDTCNPLVYCLSHVTLLTFCLSLRRSLFWTTLDRSPRVTLLCWTATLPTLPANSVSSKKRSIVVLARNLRTTQSLSNLEMQQSLPWYPGNPCVSRASPSIHHWVSQAYDVAGGKELIGGWSLRGKKVFYRDQKFVKIKYSNTCSLILVITWGLKVIWDYPQIHQRILWFQQHSSVNGFTNIWALKNVCM